MSFIGARHERDITTADDPSRKDASSPDDAPAIAVKDVSRRYRTSGEVVRALEGVSLTVRQGEFVSLVGPSGCGKSTLLKIVAGLDRPTSGLVELAGKRSDGPSRANGIVFQEATLLAWRTARENVLLPSEIQGVKQATRTQWRDRADELLDLVGLRGFETAYPHQLSGGMQQRVALARALIMKPQLLLMDEPFGALDALTRDQMNMELLRVWSSTGTSVLFVTHSVAEAVILSDRVVAMSRRPGRIAAEITVPLARPRTLDMLATAAGVAAQETVRGLLEEQS